jgi:hypothetical protein
MRKTILFLGVGILLINILAYYVLTFYNVFNFILSSTVIVFNMLLGEVMYFFVKKDGFKISFSFVFLLIGFIQFVIALIAKQEFQNNFSILLIAILVLIQLTLLVLSSKFNTR